jgi:NAD(P)-dependent dehydrogenase (short-subunit alcohol dehydrogenase family)
VKNIIITGASTGIGRSTALELSRDTNNKVFLISRDKVKLDQLLEEIKIYNESSHAYGFDLLTGDFNELLREISKYLGSVDVLINNAGALVNRPFEDISNEDFEKVMSTNFKGPFFLIQKLLPVFNEGAHVVNISSMGGFQGSVKFPGLSLYSASKGALSILTESLAVELSPRKISVNCLSLGSVQTAMFESAFPGYTAQSSSESMAHWISSFALNGHKWFNGKVLPVSISTP